MALGIPTSDSGCLLNAGVWEEVLHGLRWEWRDTHQRGGGDHSPKMWVGVQQRPGPQGQGRLTVHPPPPVVA